MTASDPPGLDSWVAIVLAAGRGTRMRSKLPKVLHPVAGRPMMLHVCDTVRAAGIERIVVVTADTDGEVAEIARKQVPGAIVAPQGEPLGTGHATLAARGAAGEAPHLLVLNADLPLITERTVRELTQRHLQEQAVLTFLTAYLEDPTGYGRVRRQNGRIQGIVEETDADAITRGQPEVNGGLYAAEAQWLWPVLAALEPSPRGEVYLTDAIARAVEHPRGADAYQVIESSEVQQVNTRVELARAEQIMRERIRRRVMLDGVTLVDPATTYIDAGVVIGPDTTLLPGVHLLGTTAVGSGCRIGPASVVRDSRIADSCEIGMSTIEGAELAEGVRVGPYSHLRPGARLDAEARVGNYVEIKASHVGPRTRIGHFSYLGDADVGADVNIGAGTVTANYDGADKHRTAIGDRAFIGSDSILIAPVVVGADARTGAGAIVTRDVAPSALVLGAPARAREPEARDETGEGV
ncbi:MAG: bifunctional UDP-N-acetylglucosamine diphosphorylase/glucosamine-1-phosphate N-acetyltransferase GlmU [Dehalococcoidia bacterium]